MPRHANNLTTEQLEEVKTEIFRGKTRGQICKEKGYTYQQLQRGLGFAWRKKPIIDSGATTEIVVTEEVSTTETA